MRPGNEAKYKSCAWYQQYLCYCRRAKIGSGCLLMTAMTRTARMAATINFNWGTREIHSDQIMEYADTSCMHQGSLVLRHCLGPGNEASSQATPNLAVSRLSYQQSNGGNGMNLTLGYTLHATPRTWRTQPCQQGWQSHGGVSYPALLPPCLPSQPC